MDDELTIEQEDELLRADMSAIASGINDQEEEESMEEETPEVEPEVQYESDEEETEKPKKKNHIAKILAEKNEYKRQAIEASERLKELQDNLGDGQGTDIDYIKNLIRKEMAEGNEVQDFFSRNPEAKEFKEELDEFRSENPNLSYDRAYKFYLAETNPQALLDEQTKNKLNANMYSTAGRTSPALRQSKTELDYSDAELDGLIKAGKIKL